MFVGPQPQSSNEDNTLPFSCDAMLNNDRDEAKKYIISTINSYEDNRYPSQGKVSKLLLVVVRSSVLSKARENMNLLFFILSTYFFN